MHADNAVAIISARMLGLDIRDNGTLFLSTNFLRTGIGYTLQRWTECLFSICRSCRGRSEVGTFEFGPRDYGSLSLLKGP
jgi:hypothetical protein